MQRLGAGRLPRGLVVVTEEEKRRKSRLARCRGRAPRLGVGEEDFESRLEVGTIAGGESANSPAQEVAPESSPGGAAANGPAPRRSRDELKSIPLIQRAMEVLEARVVSEDPDFGTLPAGSGLERSVAEESMPEESVPTPETEEG